MGLGTCPCQEHQQEPSPVRERTDQDEGWPQAKYLLHFWEVLSIHPPPSFPWDHPSIHVDRQVTLGLASQGTKSWLQGLKNYVYPKLVKSEWTLGHL